MTRRTLAVILGLLVAVVAVATLAFSLRSVFERDTPSTTAGDVVPPIAGSPTARLAVAGDTGTGGAGQRATVEQMVEEREGVPYDALLLLGDMIYEDGDAQEVEEKVIEPFAPITSDGAELLPVLGNHDYMSDEQQEIMTALGRQRPWYVERIGAVQVVVLDSNRVDDPEQTQWLQETLAEPQPPSTWTVVAMHHPAYSAGHHGSDAAVQRTWVPLFTEYDVPLVLAGHDHDYQRSVPLDGVTYVVSGAGAKLRPTGREEFTAVSSSTLHHLDLLFYEDRAEARAIDHSGRMLDQFTITR